MIQGELLIYISFIIISFVGSICSFLLCWVIWDMKIWNDFNQLIFFMTLADFIYFICYPNANVIIDYRGNEVGFYFGVCMYIGELIGGISSYIISSFISFSVVHLLHFVEVFDIKSWRKVLIAIVIIPNIIWVSITIAGYANNGPKHDILLDVGYKMTSIFRLICVAFNVISYAITYFKVQDIYKTAARENRETNRQENAIITIVDRLKWYPVLQVVSRLFPTWYAFGFSNNADVDDAGYNQNDSYRYTMNFLSVVSVVLSPVGFLIVFLLMKPTAWNHVKMRLGFKPSNYDNRLKESLLNHPGNVMGYPQYPVPNHYNSHLYIPQTAALSSPYVSQHSNCTNSSFSSFRSGDDSNTGCNWKLFEDDDLLRVISDESSQVSHSAQTSMKSISPSDH
jgi:hypothetical protein